MVLEGLLGSLFGGLFRLAPEILKYIDKKDERKHELSMFTLQTDLEKVKGSFKMESEYVEYGKAQLNAIGEAFKEQAETASKSWKWVVSASALVRPLVTYVLFGTYVVIKYKAIEFALDNAASWSEVLTKAWGAEDFAMLNMILTFWFVGRSIEKYNGVGKS